MDELSWLVVAGFTLLVPAAFFMARGARAVEVGGPLLAQILRNVPQGVFWKDLDHRYLGCNDQFARWAGLDRPESIVGLRDADLPWGADHADAFRQTERQVVEDGRPHLAVVESVRCAEGRRLSIESNHLPLFDDRGRLVGILGTWTNVSYREEAKKALRDREQRLLAIVNSVTDGILTVDEGGAIQSFNRSAEAIFGYDAAEIIGRHVSTLVPEPHASIHAAHLRSYLETGDLGKMTAPAELPAVRKDGHTVDVELALTPMRVDGQTTFVVTVHDISHRKTMESELRQSEQRLRLSARFANVGVWDWNTVNDELFWSETIPPLFGYEPGQLETRFETFMQHVHEEDRAAVRTAVDEALNQGKPYEIEHRIVRADGVERWMLERGGVIRDETGRPLRMLGVVQDITLRKAEESQLRRARDEAEVANRSKSEFISRMSHELRTPLNAIIGFADLMARDDSASAEHREYLGDMLQAGEYLHRLVDDVLSLSKLESGRAGLDLAALTLTDACRECFALVQKTAQAQGIELDISLPEPPLTLLADRTRFKQVMLNLLSNAIKYNRPKGKITVSAAKADGGRARITVADTGPGIPLELQHELFQPFNRLGREKSGIEGSGVGLVITKRLVELMAGTIQVDSVPGKGTAFHVELPLADPPAGMVPTQPAAPAEDFGGQVTVLYVEPTPMERRWLEKALSRHAGLRLVTVASPDKAVDVIGKEPVDALLMDVSVDTEAMCGAVAWLRGQPEYRHIPAIAIGADVRQQERNRVLKAGFADYITKPFKLEELSQAIARALVSGR